MEQKCWTSADHRTSTIAPSTTTFPFTTFDEENEEMMATESSTSSTNVYSLAGRNLKLTSEEDVAPYVEEIRAISTLEEIHLGGNTLGVGACRALGAVLRERTKSTLKVADFADIFTGRLISEIPDALRALCDSLVEHDVLEEINLSDNAFGGRSAEPMVNFLTHNHHFSVLKLNNNGLGVTGGQIVANALLAAADELNAQGKPSKLKTVICGRNRLEDGSAPFWAKAYAAHKNIEEVRMFQNGIRMDGIVALAQGLAGCANLKVLDLQDNTATVRGSRGIAASLTKWPNLEVLNLSDCLLKPKGGYLVLDALHKGKNDKLATLQLQYCDLDRKALDRLASALDSGALKNVEKLEINGNWADEDDECIEKIKKALEKNGHEDALDELDEMDPEGEEEAEEDEGDAEEEEGEEAAEAKEDDSKAITPSAVATTGTDAEPVEAAAAAVAAPAATLAVAGSAAAAAATGAKDTVDEKLQNLSLKDQPHADVDNTDAESRRAVAIDEAKQAEEAVKAEDEAEGEPIESAQSQQTNEEQEIVSGSAKEAEMAKPADESAKEPELAAASPSKTADASPEKKQADEEEDKTSLAAIGAGSAAVVGGAAAAATAALAGEKESSAGEVKKDSEQETHAEVAAEVAESAQEVPEEKTAAETADEVAEAAQEAPDEKTAAETADEVAEAARTVPDEKDAAETADVVDEVAKQVPEERQDDKMETPVIGAPVAVQASSEDAATERESAALGAATGLSLAGASAGVIPSASVVPSEPVARSVDDVPSSAPAEKAEQTSMTVGNSAPVPNVQHGKQGSVDLSGELYGDEAAAARSPKTTLKTLSEAPSTTTNAAGPSASASTGGPASSAPTSAPGETVPKKKGGFRAAIGAIRELLR